MNFERMRGLLLDQAIHGLLVSQEVDDGVVKQVGIAPDAESFTLPKSWKWINLKELVTPTKQTIPAENFTYIDVSSIKNFQLEGTKQLEPSNAPSRARKVVQAGMVLFATVRPYLKNICIAPNLSGSVIASTAFATMSCSDYLTNRYLFYVLISDYFTELVKGKQRGISYPAISEKDFYACHIPVPPVKEQIRIVAKLEEAFAEIDRAEKAYEELQMLAGVLRGQILQEAIQGKLVPQSDAEPVVEQIGEVASRIPFAIPEKWKWVQLKSVGQIVGGGTPKTSVADYWGDEISWITPADLGKNSSKWIHSGAKSITRKGLDESSAKLMPKGSVVYSSRAPIGHIAIADQELCTNQGCKSFVPNTDLITTEWAYYTLIARTKDIQSRASGTTFKEISGKGMGETWIALPPLGEQQRIVTKIEDLLNHVDALTA